WAFVDPLLGEMRATAIQACTADAALAAAGDGPEADTPRARLKGLSREYDRIAVRYNEALGATIRAGHMRPWSVPATAPPLEVTKRKACLKVAAMPEPEPTPVP